MLPPFSRHARPLSPFLSLIALLLALVGGYSLAVSILLLQLDDVIGLGAVTCLASIFYFAIPGCLSRRLGVGNIKGQSPTPNVIFCAVALAVSCQPLVEWAAAIDRRLCETVWNVSLDGAHANAEALSRLCTFDSFVDWLSPLFAIAVIPAISEEIFFRGAMLPIVRRLTRGWTSAVIITALIFSAVHFDMSGFLSRTIMGIIMGALFVLSRSIFVPIAYHFTNNFLCVYQVSQTDDVVAALTRLPEMPPLSATIISLVLSLALIFIIHRTADFHRSLDSLF